MKETIIINPNILNGNLTIKTIKVFQELQRRCGTKPTYVNYGEIAKTLGTSWNSVKYSINILRKNEIIKVEDEKIEILKRLVL